MKEFKQMKVSPFAVQCLLAALKEAQDTVRAYDTKAQIVGIGFIFSIGIILGFADRLPAPIEATALVVSLAWALTIGPIVLFGMVLYPSRKAAPDLEPKAESNGHCFYYRPTGLIGQSTFNQHLLACDWQSEIGYEIMKVSGLRELKRRRFLRALRATGVSYIALITFQILQTL